MTGHYRIMSAAAATSLILTMLFLFRFGEYR